IGNQEGGARGRDALPPRIRRRAGDGRRDHAQRDQQGHLRRMSRLTSLREASTPSVAVEIAAGRVSAASLEWRGQQPVIAAHASEAIPDAALVPALTTANIHDRAAVAGALGRVLERTGRPKRIGLVVSDVVAKVSLVK